MQLTNVPNEEEFRAIQMAIADIRLKRYMPAAGDSVVAALHYYMWNCDLCEAFYLPLHFAEVVCRNAVHRNVLARLGENWCQHQMFRGLLDRRYQSDLDNTIDKQRAQHGANMTNDHVVSALTFGFWEHLTTKRFERLLWSRGVNHVFPHAANMRRQDVHDQIEKVRRWRNRIAHHEAIFDKGPSAKLQEVMELIKWTCPTTAAWVTKMCRLSATIDQRPQ